MNHVLMCAFYFAPRNNVASYRSGCFAKYLPENGWLPTVLAQDWPPGNPEYDPEFIGRLPDVVRVLRVPPPKPVGFYERTILRKLVPYLYSHRVPILWWQQARRKVHEILAQTRFQAFWGTSDPMSPLALAQEAAQRQHGCWVADLRDSFNVQHFGSWYKRPFFAYQERRICRQADRVTTVSQGLAQVIEQRTKRPVQVIHNGFDPDLFASGQTVPTKVFRLVYAGKLVWPQQDPRPLLRALSACVESGQIPRGEIELSFYGSELGRFRRACPGFLEQAPIREHPRVPHAEMIQVLQTSAVLVVFAHIHERGVLTGKLFDYLGAGQAILAVPDDRGDIAAVLQQTRAGVGLSQADQIGEQLVRWYRAWKAQLPLMADRNEKEVARFSRREQTKALAAVLAEIASS